MVMADRQDRVSRNRVWSPRNGTKDNRRRWYAACSGTLDMTSEPEPHATILTLVMSSSDISSVSRAAALEFTNQSSHWGTGELSSWLTGPYAMLTQKTAKTGNEGMLAAPLIRTIDARLVDRIVRSARSEILATLRMIAADGSASFVLRSLISGFVVRCEDASRVPAWAPTSEPTRLADRVLSLFAVDYLTRPGDYESELHVCGTCESVSFDVTLRKRNICFHHVSPAIVGRLTLPYPPVGAGPGAGLESLTTLGQR